MRLASQRLADLGLTLPPVPAPLAAYVPAVRFGDLVFTLRSAALVDGQLRSTGLVGAEVSPEEATACARIAALNGLAAVADEAGELDAIARIVKVVVYVASAPGFTGQPQVANGASELLGEVFGGPVGTPAVRSAWPRFRSMPRWRSNWSSRSVRSPSSSPSERSADGLPLPGRARVGWSPGCRTTWSSGPGPGGRARSRLRPRPPPA